MPNRMTKRSSQRLDDQAQLQTCHVRSIELLKRNLTDGGVLAATPGERAEKRGYTAIFGRDAAVCAIGMAVSGDKQLERAAVTGLQTLADHQAPNGQIAKFVDLHRQGASHATPGQSREGCPGPTMSRRTPAQEEDSGVERHLARIGCEADRLEELIARTLKLARLERPMQGLERMRVDVAELLTNVVADVGIEAEAHGCSVALETDGPLDVNG